MMQYKNDQQPLIMEITVKSAQGLKNTSSAVLFSNRLRPFIALTTAPPTKDDKRNRKYTTRVDDEGGPNPTWGDKFKLPVDPTFLNHAYSSIYLQLYTKRLMLGHTQLGWCQIPAGDILEGPRQPGTVRHLSYRLRAADGSRGHGVVNIAVKLEGSLPVSGQRPREAGVKQHPLTGMCQTTIGIPVGLFSRN